MMQNIWQDHTTMQRRSVDFYIDGIISIRDKPISEKNASSLNMFTMQKQNPDHKSRSMPIISSFFNSVTKTYFINYAMNQYPKREMVPNFMKSQQRYIATQYMYYICIMVNLITSCYHFLLTVRSGFCPGGCALVVIVVHILLCKFQFHIFMLDEL